MDYKNTGHLNRDTKVLSCLLEELNKRIRLLTSVATDTQTLLQEFIHPAYTVGYAIATNAIPVTIPDNVKSYSIVNLGLNGEGLTFSDIALSGDITTDIPAALNPFGSSVERGVITNSNITVTPVASHLVAVSWIV